MKKENRLYIKYSETPPYLPIAIGTTTLELAKFALLDLYKNQRKPKMAEILDYEKHIVKPLISRSKHDPNATWQKVEWDENDEFEDIDVSNYEEIFKK